MIPDRVILKALIALIHAQQEQDSYLTFVAKRELAEILKELRDLQNEASNQTPAPESIDITNRWGVAGSAAGISMLMPPRMPLSRRDALLLAAWLVALSPVAPGEPMLSGYRIEDEFDSILQMVQNT